VRIALVPLDSRPPNWQFPQRLAEIAGVELALPPRGELGTLHSGADGLRLARWLVDTVSGADGGASCDAAVFSWDALVYGGLVQSRGLDTAPVTVAELYAELKRVDWSRVRGYAYLTIPRLGISIDSAHTYATHKAVREYFILSALKPAATAAEARLRALEDELGERTLRQLWSWRERNQSLARAALEASCHLGLRYVHAAVEDNAPSGPHLAEAAELSELARRLADERAGTRPAPTGAPTRFTVFDGADECACLLLARAVADARGLPALPLQLIVHPAVPGPDRYTGLYESHSLGDGLTFLAQLLGLDYHYSKSAARWLVVHGVQPQPDLFESEPAKVFANPYLLPRKLPGDGALYVTDLAACNGANPHLAAHLAELVPGALAGLVGFNTNFNALGVTAAWLRLAQAGVQEAAQQRFLLERLADDVVYQSLARPRLLKLLREQRQDAMDFSAANMYQLAQYGALVQGQWREWCSGAGAMVLAAAGIPAAQAHSVRFSFPWYRAFEIEAEAPL